MSSDPNRRKGARGPLAGLLGLSIVAAGAGAQQAPQAPVFGERVDVEVVNVDVIVLDRSGRRVVDLAREEFELLVDGRPVTIEYFAGPRAAAAPTLEPAAESPATELEDAAPVEPPPAPSYLVVYVDQSSLRPDRRARAVSELREFVAKLRQGEQVAIAAYATGRLHLVAPPSTDAAAIERAFDELLELPVDMSSVAEQRHLDARIRNLRIASMRDPAQMRQMLEQEAIQLEQEIRRWYDEELRRQSAAIDGLRQLVGLFAAVEGRKSLVVAGSGPTVEGAEALRELLVAQMRAIGIYNQDLERQPIELGAKQRVRQEFESMVAAAQDARVALYTVYPPDDSMLRNSAEFASAGTSDRAMSRDPAVADAAAALARMSGATGGRTFLIGRNLDRKLEEVRSDAESVYSLGFTTGAAAGSGDHRIEVRLRRPKLEARHRSSFRRTTTADLAEQALLAAATLGELSNPLAVRLTLGAERPAGGLGDDRLVAVAARLPLRSVALLPADGARRGQLSFRIALQGERGDLFLSESLEVPVSVPEAELERALAGDWVHRAEARVTPTTRRLAILVVDETAGVFSTAAVELPAPSDG